MSVAPAGATPPTGEPTTAAGYGAAWLADQVAADGSVEGGFDPLGDAGAAALALAASGVGGDAFDRALGHVKANIEAFVTNPFDPTLDDPARLARAIMLAQVAGEDPRSFAGVDLVARLEATLGLFEPGLYGAADPTFDGSFRQGLALAALAGAGETPAPSARQWLADQQCGATNPAVAGAWMAYRADVSVACPSPDPVTFSGPDTNSTAVAAMGALAAGVSLDEDPVAFLEGAQEPDGGWAYLPGGGSDPNSTSLVIRALLAAGRDPGSAAWASLLSWQQGCDAPPTARGAFTSAWADPPGSGDLLATLDAVPAAAGVPLPQSSPVSLDPDAPRLDCDGPNGPNGPDGPVTPGDPVSPAAPVGPAGTVAPATPAAPVASSPTFTG